MEGTQAGQSSQGNLFTTLADLLTPASTVPLIDSADGSKVDIFLDFLPPHLLSLAQEVDDGATVNADASSAADAAKQALGLAQKRDILRRVVRSPQFSQSLSSLTIALRDGGLPSISEALKISVQNGGFMRRGGVPLGGGDAVETFLNGVRDHVKKDHPTGQDQMDRD
jgi:26S proteasome regulatory subunit N13